MQLENNSNYKCYNKVNSFELNQLKLKRAKECIDCKDQLKTLKKKFMKKK